MLFSDDVARHPGGAVGLDGAVLVGCFHKTSLAYTGRMHPLQQHYAGGSDAALCAFGLEKIAVIAGRATGLERIQQVAAQGRPAPAAPIELPPAPGGPMQLEQGFGGGPGMAQGFGGGGLPPVDPRAASRSQQSLQPGAGDLRGSLLPTSMTGGGSIPMAAANAERMHQTRSPNNRVALPNKLASFLLPT